MTTKSETPAAEADPMITLTHAYNEATHLLPSVPIAPHLGLVAMQGVRDGRMTFRDVVTFADRLEEPHFALLREAARQDHEPRTRPIPPDRTFAITAGFTMVSLWTAARELFRQDQPGKELEVIIKPEGPDDPAITETVELLGDGDNLQTYIDTLDIAADAMRSPGLRREALNPYKTAIIDFANEYDGVTRGTDPVRWAQLMHLTGLQRQIVSDKSQKHIMAALLAERGARINPGRLHHLSARQIKTVAHNLTRYKPVREWFAGPSAE